MSKILVENNCAVGIKLASGDSYYADYVISASDGYSTIYQLLEGKYVDTSIQERYSSWSINEPMLMFSYGFNTPSPPLNWMTLLNLREPFLLADTLVSSLAVRNFSYGNRFAPTNKSLIQVSFESDWDFWYNLYENDLEQYKVLKKEYALLILDIICKIFNLPQDKHELTDVATPITFWRYTKNYRGSFMGFLPSPKEAMKPIDKSIKGLSNFFMAGQWSMAMGGVQPVLYSGKHVIELLCNKDKKKFKT